MLTHEKAPWLLLTLAFTLAAAGCANRVLSPRVGALAQQLREAGRVESSAIGAGGMPSKVYAIFDRLQEEASQEELFALLKDRNPVVRVYAFWGLAERLDKDDLFRVLVGCLSDSEEVHTQLGCLGEWQQVADVLIDYCFQDLTEDQWEELAHWLVTHHNNLRARTTVLYRREFGSPYHSSIRTLAEAGAEGSLTALARYQDEADVPVILKHLNADSLDALTATEAFPHPAFFPVLASLHAEILRSDGWSNEMRQYYRAVAAYKTPEAWRILESTLGMSRDMSLRDYHVGFAFGALICHGDVACADLLFRFFESKPDNLGGNWMQGEGLADQLLEILWRADPNRTLRDVKGFLMERYASWICGDPGIAMANLLLREMKQEEAFAVINQTMAWANVHDFPVFAEVAAQCKSESSIPILFERLKDDNPWIRLAAFRSILAYGRKDLRERLRRALDEKAATGDSEELRAMRKQLESAENTPAPERVQPPNRDKVGG